MRLTLINTRLYASLVAIKFPVDIRPEINPAIGPCERQTARTGRVRIVESKIKNEPGDFYDRSEVQFCRRTAGTHAVFLRPSRRHSLNVS